MLVDEACEIAKVGAVPPVEVNGVVTLKEVRPELVGVEHDSVPLVLVKYVFVEQLGMLLFSKKSAALFEPSFSEEEAYIAWGTEVMGVVEKEDHVEPS